MFVGEIAQIHAEVSYASNHSLEVQCTVYAENVVKGNRRLTNRYDNLLLVVLVLVELNYIYSDRLFVMLLV